MKLSSPILSCARRAKRRPASAFTLVELLVVIGIIAVLISILLPSLSRARDAANRVACLSNIKQINTAILMYVDANKGYLPFTAPNFWQHDEDWIWWQLDTPGKPRISRVGEGGIGPYLALSRAKVGVLKCPADDLQNHARTDPTYGKYPFSYAMNEYMGSYPPPTVDIWSVYKLGSVRRGAEKILIFEEADGTIDDGYGSITAIPGNLYTNLVALRHDRKSQHQLDDPFKVFTEVPNIKARGNVGFCDGHADTVYRTYAHSIKHCAPDVNANPWSTIADMFPNEP